MSGRATMELARPQIPEKPPVAAKPRHRLAPPRPPKPSTIASSLASTTLPPSSLIHQTAQHDQSQNVSQVPQNISPSTQNTPKPKLSLSARTSSAEALSSTSGNLSPRSPELPPLPCSPPPSQRQGLKPLYSLSLPASFRNTNLNKSDRNTSLTLTTLIQFTPPSSLSSTQQQKSPIRHVSPPRRTPPTKTPKPKNLFTASPPKKDTSLNRINSISEIEQEKEKKAVLNSTRQQPVAPGKSAPTHTNTQANSKTNTVESQTHKQPVSPPQRPTSPPSRSTSFHDKPSLPTQLSPSLEKPTVATTKLQDVSPVKESSTPDSKSPPERKLSAPPPLPKNPPRGGIPRKQRSSSIKSPTTPEPKHIADIQQEPSHKVSSHDRTNESGSPGYSLESDTVNNSETKLQPEESSITGGHLVTLKARTPPKPRPRTRPSFPLKNDNEDIIFEKSANIDLSKGSENSGDHNSISTNFIPDSDKKPELDYAEVYQRRSECHIQTGSGNCDDSHIKIASTSNDLDISQFISSNVEPCAILRNPKNSELNLALHVNTDASENEVAKRNSISEDSQSIFLEEPEATCGMLREIEELLKNKLGDIELTLEQKSAENSTQNTDTVEENSESVRRSRGDSFLKSRSPSTSPIRPPRPKRQATISKLLGSQESLNTSSTECLATPDTTSKSASSSNSSSKKVIPPKPKRTFLPRISRSNSDVTGMKSPTDSSNPDLETTDQQEEQKPYLPPRLESLRRSDSASSCQSPPPLPPRNKPRSSSLREVSGTDSETPPELPSRSSLRESNSDREEQEMADNVNTTQEMLGPDVTPTTKKVKIPSSLKPRPSRKAPPPPPGSPRRSATFSPGDARTPSMSESEESNKLGTSQTSLLSPTVKKSESVVYRRSKVTTEDHDYHEISDSARALDSAKEEREETPPPALPPRSSRADAKDDSQNPPANNEPEEAPIKFTKEAVKYCPPESKPTTQELSADHLKKSSNPKEQKQMEKMAKSALIQKVAQGLGLGKSIKKSKSIDSSGINDELSKHAAEDSRKEKINIDPNTVTESVNSTEPSLKDSTNKDPSVPDVKANSGQTGDDEAVLKEPSDALTGGSSSSSLDRPLSMASQQSTSSEQEGNGQAPGAQNVEEIVSSGSDTEPEEDKEEIYAQRKAKKVFFIAKEIASSESTFVDVLRLLNLDFRFHISSSTEKLGHAVVPSEILNKILDFLPQLQNFNEDLLKDLQERIDKWETNPRLADIFVKKGPFLKLYSSYIRNFENATAILEDAVKKNPAFAAAVKEFEMSPKCAKLALKHYMLKPIQRIPQYKLLLQDYLKHLTEASPDYKDTVTALNIVSEVADHANDSMRHGDNVQKLLEVQRSLIGPFEVIQPGRVLVKQGELQKLSRKEMQPRMFFLFNDVLLYTTQATSGYKINNILPLTGMKINSAKLEDYKFEFNIISVQRSFTLSASSYEEKEQWVSALQTAIDDNAKKHHTFQAVKQGTQTSLLDKDFVLGHKAPLWVPDARVTMCMLCLLEFTLTWRRHHCRSCGRVVCSHCSENKAPLRYLKYQSARVCDNCFDKLRAAMTNEYSEEDSTTSVSEGVAEDTTDTRAEEASTDLVKHESGLSLHNLMSRFQKIRVSNRDKRKPGIPRPSVLKEVHANDEGSDISGYLRVYRSRKWKRLWFVVKGKVLYTYKASEDMAARESMPLLGYEVSRPTTWFEGADPDHLLELTHQNNQPLTTRKDGNKIYPHTMSSTDKTTQRLIFRTDSSTAAAKWVAVLKEASLT